jgi:hypothetical protein
MCPLLIIVVVVCICSCCRQPSVDAIAKRDAGTTVASTSSFPPPLPWTFDAPIALRETSCDVVVELPLLPLWVVESVIDAAVFNSSRFAHYSSNIFIGFGRPVRVLRLFRLDCLQSILLFVAVFTHSQASPHLDYSKPTLG